ncbi:hypothetical protein A2U01_0059473, partial [Trifolium medium]|nr:hypothetical protein [Trifolium medium]
GNRSEPREVPRDNRYEEPDIRKGSATAHRMSSRTGQIPLMLGREGFPFLFHTMEEQLFRVDSGMRRLLHEVEIIIGDSSNPDSP